MYKVVDTNTHKTIGDGFANRTDAKVMRDKRNGGKPKDDKMPRYIVSRGMFHPKGPSNGISTQTIGRKSYL